MKIKKNSYAYKTFIKCLYIINAIKEILCHRERQSCPRKIINGNFVLSSGLDYRILSDLDLSYILIFHDTNYYLL